MEERTRDLIDYTVFWIGVAMVLLGLTGEILGWWGDLGLLVTGVGVAFGLWSSLDIFGRRALDGIGRVETSIQGMAGNQRRMLENQDGQIARLDRIQDHLDERLPGGV